MVEWVKEVGESECWVVMVGIWVEILFDMKVGRFLIGFLL